MKRYALLIWLVLASPLWAASVTLPKEVSGEPGAFIKVPATTDGTEIRWYSPDKGLQVFPVELLKDSKTAVVIGNTPGRYRLVAWTAVKDVPSDPAICTVIIGDAPPVPPGPGPTPPDPPTPGPAPISGKRVLIVYETADAPKMPAKQQDILYGRAVRDYLNSACEVGSDGKTKEWRIWDKDVATENEAGVWKNAMKRQEEGLGERKIGKRTAVPWVIVGGKNGGYEGPLPASVDEFMALVKKHLD